MILGFTVILVVVLAGLVGWLAMDNHALRRELRQFTAPVEQQKRLDEAANKYNRNIDGGGS